MLIKECNLEVNPLLKLLVEEVDRGKLIVYRTIIVETTITNLYRYIKTYYILFIVTNLQRYKLYLGLPQINIVYSKISYISQYILFRGIKAKNIAKFQKVAIKDIEQFKRSIQNLLVDIYIYFINFIGQRGLEEGIIGYLPL